MARKPYVVHRYAVRNITNYSKPTYGVRTQVWAVCDKLQERAHNDGVPAVVEVHLTRQRARAACKTRNSVWKYVLSGPGSIQRKEPLRLVTNNVGT